MRKLRMGSRVHAPLFVGVVAAIAVSGGACTCSKATDASGDAAPSTSTSTSTTSIEAGEPGGLSAPIAAARGEQGDVVVAGLDVPARSIRVQRISAKDEVLADKTVLEGVSWSTES